MTGLQTEPMNNAAPTVSLLRPGKPLKDAWVGSAGERRRRALETARREGVEEGFKAGVASVQERMDALRAETDALRDGVLRSLSEKEGALVKEAEAVLPSLALEVARRVIAGVSFDGEAVKRRVEEVLAEAAPKEGALQVRLSPGDLERLGEAAQAIEGDYPELRFEADSALVDGDCVVKGRFGVADARLKTRWKMVADLLAH